MTMLSGLIRGKQGNANPEIKSRIVCYIFILLDCTSSSYCSKLQIPIFSRIPYLHFATLWTQSFLDVHLLLLNAVLTIAFVLATVQVQEQIFYSEED